MTPSWELIFLIAATIFPLFKAAPSGHTTPRRQVDMDTISKETPVSREYFYVGGRYVDDGKGKDQHIFSDQMYVEKLSANVSCPKPDPLVFIHGQGQTGTVGVS